VVTAHAVDGNSDCHDPERDWLTGWWCESLIRGPDRVGRLAHEKTARGEYRAWFNVLLIASRQIFMVTAETNYSSFLVFKTLRPR